jgi:hypothetical protein
MRDEVERSEERRDVVLSGVLLKSKSPPVLSSASINAPRFSELAVSVVVEELAEGPSPLTTWLNVGAECADLGSLGSSSTLTSELRFSKYSPKEPRREFELTTGRSCE